MFSVELGRDVVGGHQATTGSEPVPWQDAECGLLRGLPSPCKRNSLGSRQRPARTLAVKDVAAVRVRRRAASGSFSEKWPVLGGCTGRHLSQVWEHEVGAPTSDEGPAARPSPDPSGPQEYCHWGPSSSLRTPEWPRGMVGAEGCRRRSGEGATERESTPWLCGLCRPGCPGVQSIAGRVRRGARWRSHCGVGFGFVSGLLPPSRDHSCLGGPVEGAGLRPKLLRLQGGRPTLRMTIRS